jgi:hypothetical protein
MSIFDRFFNRNKSADTATTPAPPAATSFEKYSGSGVCDVCNRGVGPGGAFLVPVRVFYSSPKYKHWILTGPFSGLMRDTIQTYGGIDRYLAETAKLDTSTHSAVCPSCIHLFR